MNKKPSKSLFIVLEGIDGSGTTTQGNLLVDRFQKNNIPAIFQAEPTNGPIGALIRNHLQDRLHFDDHTLALLFAADRSDHIRNSISGIKHFLNQDITVISDRYLLSSLVYQQDCLDVKKILECNSDYYAPDITFYLNINPEISLKRKMLSTPQREKFDHLQMQINFHNRYLDLIHNKAIKGDIEIIDAHQDKLTISDNIWKIVQDKWNNSPL
jgi:dTMP kinase